jgi:hypothetical protein
MRKAVLILGLMVVLMFAFAACGDDESSGSTSSASSVSKSSVSSTSGSSSDSSNSDVNSSAASTDVVDAAGTTIALGDDEFGTTGGVGVVIAFKRSDGTFTGTANGNVPIGGSYTKNSTTLKLTFTTPGTANALVEIEGALSDPSGLGTATFDHAKFTGALTISAALPDYPAS